MVSEDKAGQFERGLRAFRAGDYKTAIEYLSEAVEYDENNHRAWNALGTSCAKEKRYKDADLCFENAITLDPDNPIYQKNRNTNAKHLTNPPPNIRITPGSLLDRPPFDRIPFDLIPVDKKYVAIGGVGLILILIIAILVLTGVLFHAPPQPSGPPIVLTANLSGNTVLLTNNGGPDIKSVRSFTWKVNDRTISTGEPGETGTLGLEPGSTASVPLSDLMETNISQGMRIMVIANFKDGSAQVVLSTALPPPPPSLLPVAPATITPEPTPTLPPDIPRFSKGEVIIDNSTGIWWLVTTPPQNGTYALAHAARLPDGSFTAADTGVENLSVKSFDQLARSIGYQTVGNTPPGLSSLTPPPATAVPTLHPQPIYTEGDLISTGPAVSDTVIAILGYDSATDQYQVDTLNKYYTGEWGYRSDNISEWYIRPTLEQQYSHRINRIPLSDIGIGADSAPPRTKPKFTAGNIVSPDTAGLENLAVIISYNPDTDQYETDTIRPAYNGGWIRTGKTALERRVFFERDHPVIIRTVDIERVQVG
ncbi:MAG: tetratricopeptide repeat protein [Methanobacteriota archaeon]